MGKRKVYVDMVGDLFHMGHVALLRAARELGDAVVVGVISDELAATYKRRPIMTLEERIAVIAACRYVDEVIPDAPLVVTSAFLRSHGIAIVAHGDDISSAVIDEVYGEPQREGKVRLLRYTDGISTTAIIGRIQARGSGTGMSDARNAASHDAPDPRIVHATPQDQRST